MRTFESGFDVERESFTQIFGNLHLVEFYV